MDISLSKVWEEFFHSRHVDLILGQITLLGVETLPSLTGSR